ncbi:MAG: pitrilysin family protein [Anaerolineae bacterium]|nr:pitrilysin family protein [Anaerolineae bacterium]
MPSVYKTKLNNGLTIVLREMHHAPVTSFWVWYRVGSRNEKPGITGASHWVEHMMFKGSPAFPPGTLDRTVARIGGRFNAFTWVDFTAYFETLPSAHIDLALELESDRMVNAFVDETTVSSERTVILSERHMYENRPMFLLHEELAAVAFRVHPYHHEVIGDEVDLETMSRDDLFSHYRAHYVPNNAVAVAVGDFDADAMLEKIAAAFGEIEAGPPVAPVLRREPPQRGERRVLLEGPGDAAYLVHAYRAPEATHPDFYPLVLLNAALAGGSSLGFFAGAGSNKSSRLYRRLVSGNLAATVSGSMTPTIDPYLYRISAVARPGRSLSEIEQALDAAVAELADEPITQAELDKALKRAKAQFVMAGESVTGQAQMIGMSEMVAGDYSWFEETLEQLNAVTLADVERVRRGYLRPSQRTVGWYQPVGQENGS